MYQPIIQRSYLTEIKLSTAPTANQRIFFLDIPELRDDEQGKVVIVGVECFNATSLITSPNLNAVVATVAGMTLTLTEQSTETIFQYVCSDLNPSANSGVIRMFNKKRINIPKSYITIFSIAGIAINQAVIFNFLYEKVK